MSAFDTAVLIGKGRQYCPDWRLVDQSTPNTVPPKNPNGFQILSTGENLYDPVSGGTKAVLKFVRPFTINAVNQPLIFLGNTTPVPSFAKCTATGVCAIQLSCRLRLIVNNFDPTKSTYNNVLNQTGITLDATSYEAVLAEASGNITATTVLQALILSGAPIVVHVSDSRATKFYGAVIDCKAVSSGTTSSPGAKISVLGAGYPPFIV